MILSRLLPRVVLRFCNASHQPHKALAYRPEPSLPIREDAIESPREVTDYNRYREVYDLPELGSEFVDRGETFTITGLNPRSTKYPVLVTRADGKRFKFPVITVLAHGEFP